MARPIKNTITDKEYFDAKELAKTNKLKRVDKRLQVIILRYEGMNDSEIAKKLDYHPRYISQLCAEFKKKGLAEYASHKYGGNNQAVDVSKEKEILESFRIKAQAGQIVTAADIKKAFDEYRGKDTGTGYIYMLLARHDWRMVMPRGKHPKGASDEEILATNRSI